MEALAGGSQRGFLRDRPILANVIYLEAALQAAALEGDCQRARLFDTRAAVPGLEHDCLQGALENRGCHGAPAPPFEHCAGQSCCLAMAGRRREDFPASAGARQGTL